MGYILESIHAVQKPNRTRNKDRPMSVICCGMPRTRTDSLAHVLATLGYEGVYHGSLLPVRPEDCVAWVEAMQMKQSNNPAIREAGFWDTVLGDYQAITDFPGATFVAELMEAYPQAKIVLNMREVDRWKASMQRAMGFYLRGRRYFELFDSSAFWIRRYTETNFNPMFSGNFTANAEQVYRDRCALVRRIVPKDRLLEWYVEEEWAPLCCFLDKRTPDVSFPRGNAIADIIPRLEARTRALKRKAWQRIGIFVALLVGVVLLSLQK